MKINCETEAIEQMAKEILAAARTAPKGKGVDSIVTALAEPDDIQKIASAMRKLSEEKGAYFARDAQNIEDSDAVVLIGLKDAKPCGLNCGACGFSSCAELSARKCPESAEFKGPICAIKSIDLGIALGSAAAKAKDMCVDTRLMYTAGAAACSSGLLDAEMAIAIPMKIAGKNIYFDRQ